MIKISVVGINLFKFMWQRPMGDRPVEQLMKGPKTGGEKDLNPYNIVQHLINLNFVWSCASYFYQDTTQICNRRQRMISNYGSAVVTSSITDVSESKCQCLNNQTHKPYRVYIKVITRTSKLWSYLRKDLNVIYNMNYEL